MFQSDYTDEQIKKKIIEFKDRIVANQIDNIVEELSLIFGTTYVVPTGQTSIPKGTKIYRVRPIPEEDTDIPLKTIKSISDVWEPPEKYIIKPGRLNRVAERVLYCCPEDYSLAVEEARATESEYFAMIIYTTSRDIMTAPIGNYDHSNLPYDLGTRQFYTFLEEEFSRFVEPEREVEYLITQAIADSFYNYPGQDAWLYRSVQSNEKFNLAFLPEKAKTCLSLNHVLICNNYDENNKMFSVKCFVRFDDNGDAVYYEASPEGMRNIFPELTWK